MAESEHSGHRTPGPLVLDAQASENWRKFLMQFEIYLVAKGKEKATDKVKVNLLLNCAGPDAIEEYSHFDFNEEKDKESYELVCGKFKELCKGAKNVIYERLLFNQRHQKEGERIDHFVSDLKRLSLNCDFGVLRDSLIRDCIVGGVVSDELRGELLKKPDLTLQSAHDYCRTHEATELQKFKFMPSSRGHHQPSHCLNRQFRGKRNSHVNSVVIIIHSHIRHAALLSRKNVTIVEKRITLPKYAKRKKSKSHK